MCAKSTREARVARSIGSLTYAGAIPPARRGWRQRRGTASKAVGVFRLELALTYLTAI